MGLIDKNETIFKLLKGIPVAVPTETVYGLAAPISNDSALKKIFSIKKRPPSNPLIVHVSSLDMALNLVNDLDSNIKKEFKLLAQTFWPGPLTLVLKKNASEVSDLITAFLPTVAIRCPKSDILLELINEVGPLAAPSANLFKTVSPTKAEHVLKELSEVDVLEGPTSSVGLESTIYDIKLKTILRPGVITAGQISKLINKEVIYSEKLKTPGSEKNHYQPTQSLWVFESKGLLETNSTRPHTIMPFRDKPEEASKNLYQDLRSCDKNEKTIFALFKPEWRNFEDWTAFENRLLKASSKWFAVE